MIWNKLIFINIMNINKYIDIKIFIISFAIGLFFVYILGPEKKVIYVYPNPKNVKDFLVKDKSKNCFQYKYEEIDCPFNSFSIKQTPIQE